jgi:phosphopantothenoylcysteine decarboxylase
MPRILLGVTGSVAAIYTPELFQALREEGHEVKVLATPSSLYFFDPALIAPIEEGLRNREVMMLDEDEWPGPRYQRGDKVQHIELRRWADLLLIAPLDANTLAKMALGMCDNSLTCVVRAWDRSRPLLVAPAMNTLMWDHPATARHLAQLRADLGARLGVIEPIHKRLACDDVGAGALAERPALLAAVRDALRT